MRNWWCITSLAMLLGCSPGNGEKSQRQHAEPPLQTEGRAGSSDEADNESATQVRIEPVKKDSQEVEVIIHGAPRQSYIDSVKAAKAKGKK